MQGSGQNSQVTETRLSEELPPIPRGGGRFWLHGDGDAKAFTYSALPPDVYRLARGAQTTAFGLMGLFAAIIILGPFARLLARRIERRMDRQPSPEVHGLRQQIEQLQQSMDTMSVEIERISESQRFQSKLLYENRPAATAPFPDHIS